MLVYMLGSDIKTHCTVTMLVYMLGSDIKTHSLGSYPARKLAWLPGAVV